MSGGRLVDVLLRYDDKKMTEAHMAYHLFVFTFFYILSPSFYVGI